MRLRATQASLREAGGRLAAERDALRRLTTRQSALGGTAKQRLSTSVLASQELNRRFAALSAGTATNQAAAASTPATAAAKGTSHYAALLALAEKVAERHLPREDDGAAGSGALEQAGGGAARLARRGGILLKWSALGPAPFYFWIDPHGPATEGRAAGPHLAWRVPGAAPSCRAAQSVPLAALQLSPGDAAWKSSPELLGATPPGLVAGSGFAVRASAGSGGGGGEGVGTLLLLARDGAQRTAWLQVLQQQARAARAAGGGIPGAGDPRLVNERVARARAAAGSGRTVAHSFGAQLQSAGEVDELGT